MSDVRRARWMTVALAIVLAPAALYPIHSYDFFWHLATGRWIVEHRGLPLMDPFSIASDRVPWINGEWLFEAVLHLLGSITAIALVRAACVAALFAIAFHTAARSARSSTALMVTTLAFAAAWDRLDARPSTAAAALLAASVILLERRHKSSDIAFVVLTIIWINVHPSALLAPVIALLLRRVHWVVPASVAALLVNPFGFRAVLAPIELTRFAQSGAFVNREWLPSTPADFPLLYVLVLAGGAALVLALPRRWDHIAVFALLAYLALAHVRNQGLFLAAFPILAAGPIDSLLQRIGRERAAAVAAYGASAIALLAVFVRGPHGPFIAPNRFPMASFARTRAFSGNIYNPDQFGGFLIWATYPERRVLTDGRNELYRSFLPEFDHARRDSRAWHALLDKYRIAVAIDEYRPPLDVTDARSGAHRTMPASLAYWPRREWALVGYDGVSMAFVRRADFAAAQVERCELKNVVPDAR